MKLTTIGSNPVIVTEGQKHKFTDFEQLVRHINRNNLSDKLEGLEVLPPYWYNRINGKPRENIVFTSLQPVSDLKGEIASPVMHEAHIAQLTPNLLS